VAQICPKESSASPQRNFKTFFKEKEMQTVTFIIFCATVLPLIFTPEPDVIYITTRGITQGRQAGLISMLGVCTGYAVHTLLAVLGLTVLVYTSEALFSLVRYAGAGYLLYLGIKAIRSKSQIEFKGDKNLIGNRRMFLTGVATSVMNPKGILLFFSYFPQFVVPEAGNVTGQLFLIGTLFTLMCGLVYGMYGFFSGAIGERLSTTPRIADLMKWLTGSVLIGLGVRMALPDKK
jgi:threonine/homoserine/homoserine lactone efflux protein